MRILIVNPNTTEAVTSLMLDAGPRIGVARCRSPRRSPRRGAALHHEPRGSADRRGDRARDAGGGEGGCDAAILAAFGDPGLFGARELFDFPVIGISEAAMLTACMLGGRFLIVTFASVLCGWFRDCVAMHRLEDRCAGVVALDRGFGSLEDVRETNWEALVTLANVAIADRDADVAILAGAPLAGLASRARDLIPVPVIDPIAAAVKQAEALVALADDAKPRAGVSSARRRRPRRDCPRSSRPIWSARNEERAKSAQVGLCALAGDMRLSATSAAAPADLPPARVSQVAVEFSGRVHVLRRGEPPPVIVYEPDGTFVRSLMARATSSIRTGSRSTPGIACGSPIATRIRSSSSISQASRCCASASGIVRNGRRRSITRRAPPSRRMARSSSPTDTAMRASIEFSAEGEWRSSFGEIGQGPASS